MESKLPPFYVGQKVVCVNPNMYGFPIKGKTYTVLAIKQKSCCGTFIIDIGSCSAIEAIGSVCVCGAIHSYTGMYNQSRFRPLESQPFPLITLTQIQTKEAEKEQVKEYDKQLIGGN